MGPRSTTSVLAKLRALMNNPSYVPEKLHAYLVPTADAHQSEYVSEHDKRRAFLSGFDGSAGIAVVLEHKAALFTDGRYHLQAASQLDENWTLMKMGLPDTPTMDNWLKTVLPAGGRVGVDPLLTSADQWKKIKSALDLDGHLIVGVKENLVDLIWENQPHVPCNPLIVLPEEYTGVTWQSKVKDIREQMAKEEATALVVSALDEVAWLLNLRGSDIDFNPVFFAYVIITVTEVHLFIDEKKLNSTVRQHLTSPSDEIIMVFHPYTSVIPELENLVGKQTGKTWVSNSCSQALYQLVPKRRRVDKPSPVAIMKAVKNPTEIKAMISAHVKDAAALCEYFDWLEQQVPQGGITEISGAEKLEQLRKEQGAVGLSFETISGSGPNGAVIHYRPSESTNRSITTSELYLCDSGGQYLDGTTDVTRTVHFGQPTQHEKDCFTRVLKGHINLASAIFPNGVKGYRLDSLARTPLWDAGLDYMHGTGHGVGAFLNVHEGPCGIHHRVGEHEVALKEGMILSDEPGYYEQGSFGIRIESLVLVKKIQTQHDFMETGFLTFEPITYIPIQRKMIDISSLNDKQILWLNDYHKKCCEMVEPLLITQGKHSTLQWLHRETKPL